MLLPLGENYEAVVLMGSNAITFILNFFKINQLEQCQSCKGTQADSMVIS
jgi:hypothetical protein